MILCIFKFTNAGILEHMIQCVDQRLLLKNSIDQCCEVLTNQFTRPEEILGRGEEIDKSRCSPKWLNSLYHFQFINAIRNQDLCEVLERVDEIVEIACDLAIPKHKGGAV